MISFSSAALAFSGPALAPQHVVPAVHMKAAGEIGVTPPLGVYDPLNLLAEPVEYPRRSYRRYVELEIKHGRIAMLACLGVIVTETGFRWPGYISKTLDLKFEDIPGGALAYGTQDPRKAPGDVGGISWIRYSDPEVKKFKLNAERNNGRAAMMGIIGMMTHNALGVDALFPLVQ
jgi:hypothetical protein